LAAIGLFGLISFNVAQRRREIGIRVALGAAPLRIVSLIAWNGMRIVLAGVAAAAGVYAVSELLRSLLFGVEATDGAVLTAVPSLLIGVAAAACLIPAARAARSCPLSPLRQD
jgi:ABC-type lipoprotein release transport system permease subunit